MFRQAEILHLLWLAPVLLLLLVAYRRWQIKAAARLGVASTLQPAWLFWLRGLMTIGAFCLMALAWANPQKNARIKQTTQKSADAIILLDISRSMLVQDVAPSRLELAQWFAAKLIKALEGERIGLVFFAGSSFLQMPLSADYPFMLESIQSASPELLSTQGSDIVGAIELAMQSFDEAPAGRAIILISDGEHHDEDPAGKAAEAFDDGVVLYTVLCGTPEGGPIPDAGNYKRDQAGNLVRSMANPTAMQEMARAGGGVMYHVSQGDAAVAAIRQAVQNMDKRALSVRSYTEFDPLYSWFLFPAWLLLLGAWLPGLLNGVKRISLMVFLFIGTNMAIAQTPGHGERLKGDAAYQNGRFQESEKYYQKSAKQSPENEKSHYNLGNAQYRQGDYEAAAQSFGQAAKLAKLPADKADAWHNQGNAFLHRQQYKEAVQVYEQSLRLRPGDPATKANLQFAKQKLKESEAAQKQQQNRQDGPQKPGSGEQNPPAQDPQQKDDDNGQNPKPQTGQSQQQQNKTESRNPGAQAQQSKKEALKILETTVGRDDKKTARKYRETEQKNKAAAGQKDW